MTDRTRPTPAIRRWLADIGGMGGRSKSPRKAEAARRNAQKRRKVKSEPTPTLAETKREV